jgi:hypothetical protein
VFRCITGEEGDVALDSNELGYATLAPSVTIDGDSSRSPASSMSTRESPSATAADGSSSTLIW